MAGPGQTQRAVRRMAGSDEVDLAALFGLPTTAIRKRPTLDSCKREDNARALSASVRAEQKKSLAKPLTEPLSSSAKNNGEFEKRRASNDKKKYLQPAPALGNSEHEKNTTYEGAQKHASSSYPLASANCVQDFTPLPSAQEERIKIFYNSNAIALGSKKKIISSNVPRLEPMKKSECESSLLRIADARERASSHHMKSSEHGSRDKSRLQNLASLDSHFRRKSDFNEDKNVTHAEMDVTRSKSNRDCDRRSLSNTAVRQKNQYYGQEKSVDNRFERQTVPETYDNRKSSKYDERLAAKRPLKRQLLEDSQSHAGSRVSFANPNDRCNDGSRKIGIVSKSARGSIVPVSSSNDVFSNSKVPVKKIQMGVSFTGSNDRRVSSSRNPKNDLYSRDDSNASCSSRNKIINTITASEDTRRVSSHPRLQNSGYLSKERQTVPSQEHKPSRRIKIAQPSLETTTRHISKNLWAETDKIRESLGYRNRNTLEAALQKPVVTTAERQLRHKAPEIRHKQHNRDLSSTSTLNKKRHRVVLSDDDEIEDRESGDFRNKLSSRRRVASSSQSSLPDSDHVRRHSSQPIRSSNVDISDKALCDEKYVVQNMSSIISQIFGVDKRKFGREALKHDTGSDVEVASFENTLAEERRSIRMAHFEDAKEEERTLRSRQKRSDLDVTKRRRKV